MSSLETRNCGECPSVLQCIEQLRESGVMKTAMSKMAINEAVDSEIAPALLDFLQTAPDIADQVMPGCETEQDVAAAFRKGVGSMLERMDQKDESLVALTNMSIAACSGPLKMRAAKDGTTATATLCNSSLLPAGKQSENVTVRRQR